MRRILAFVFAISLILPCSVARAEGGIAEGMASRAVRGVVDMVTGIVEVPMQIYKGYDKGVGLIKNKPLSKTVGTVLGFFRGFGHAAGRVVSGGTELFGFWAVSPESNKGVGIPFDAQYSWEYGSQYDVFKPTLAEGLKPIGRKLVHGVANGFAGIVELPGQTMKGASEGRVLTGLGKGFWFWWSRMVYGLGEVYGCLVPNHPDNPGYHFTGEWPWSDLSAQIK